MPDETDPKALQAEVERLRAHNAELEKKVEWRNLLRKVSRRTLLVLGCGLAVLSLLAIWLRVTLLDTNRYVQTVAPIAAQPAVQDAVADRLSARINEKLDVEPLIREALPDRVDVLAPALDRGLKSFIDGQIRDFTHSPRFQELWIEANRRVHGRLVELLTGGRSGRLALEDDTVYLDLSPAVDRVKEGLTSRGLSRLAAAIPPTVDGRVPLLTSDGITDAQRGIRILKAVAIILPLFALLSLIGYVLLSDSKRRGLLWAAIGLAISMLLLIAVLALARSAYLDSLGAGQLPRDAASNIFDAISALLRDGVRVVVISAAVVAVIALIAGLPLRSLAVRLWTAFASDGRTAWIAEHRNVLMIAIGVLSGLVLLIWSPLTPIVLLVLVLVAGGLIGAILAISAAADPADHADPVPPLDPGAAGVSG